MVGNQQKSVRTEEIEHFKTFVDYLKHLTTLSTGSIVLMAAFLEKLFVKPLWKFAVVISLIGFMLSVLSSTIAHTIQIYFHAPGVNYNGINWATILGGIAVIITWIGFLVGILSLAIFAIRNLIP